MKYYLSHDDNYGLSIAMRDGSEEEQQSICLFAISWFSTRYKQVKVVDTYGSLMFYLNDVKQFRRLIKWKQFFDSWDPNKPFSFVPLARQSLKISREVLNNQVFENSRGNDSCKAFASKFEFN